MFLFRKRSPKSDVCAGSTLPRMGVGRGCFSTRFLCAVAAIILLRAPIAICATTQAVLDQDLTALQTQVKNLRVNQALLSVGIASGTIKSPITLPVNFIPGPVPIAALQATVLIGSSITVSSVSAGPSATTSGKSVSSAGNLFLIFGLNQNPIIQGNVANLSLTIGALPKGFYTVTLTNPIASDANGNSVLMNTISGTIRIGL